MYVIVWQPFYEDGDKVYGPYKDRNLAFESLNRWYNHPDNRHDMRGHIDAPDIVMVYSDGDHVGSYWVTEVIGHLNYKE